MSTSRSLRWTSLAAGLGLAFSMVAVDHAEARRGGSFGSRGTRTYQSAPATSTAPSAVAPVQRSMTPNSGTFGQTPAAGQTAGMAQQRRPGFFGGGMLGGMLGGLAFGGLLGMLMGNGFGGLGGMFGFLIQALLIGGGIMLLMRFLRSRNSATPAMAGPRGGMARESYDDTPRGGGLGGGLGGLGGIGSKLGGLGGGLGGGANASARRPANPDEIGVTSTDLDTFEKMLREVQGAYGREDYATLRSMTTPEMMSYLSEELGENASKGLRNEVSEVSLLQGDVAESWREGNRDYATVAMRYSSIDATKERATGKVVDGDAARPTETTEIWTFVREAGRNWQLSAIQNA